ncbi:acyloxyacyl hydrolase [Stenotrophomonas forensis]
MRSWTSLLMLLPALPAAAETGPSIGLQLGHGRGDYQRAGLIWDSGPLWRREPASGRPLELAMELGFARWQASDPQCQHAWQASAIPMLRWRPNARLFVEAGIGPTLFDTTRVGGRHISTAFQFGDHLGIGLRVAEHHSLSLRYSHYSNASIKKPNPGLDLLQLSWRVEY